MVHLEPVLLDSLNSRKQSGSGHFTPTAGYVAPIADLRLSSPIEPCLSDNAHVVPFLSQDPFAFEQVNTLL